MYTYDNNPVMLTQIICVTMSLLSIIGVIIVFILGKGWRYFIVLLFFTQIICMFFFFIPQLLGPFIIYTEEKSPYCDIPITQPQECIPDGLCRLQTYFVNSSFLASTLISLYSCFIIKKTLNLITPLKNKNQIYWIHFYIGIITFATCIPMLFIDYEHYGISWRRERIYYICNMSLNPTDNRLWTLIVFYVSIVVNIVLLIFSFLLYCDVKQQKKRLNKQLTLDISQYSALNLYIQPLTLTGFWSINLLFKIIDRQTNLIYNVDNLILNILWLVPQFLITLQGFNYASIFFYSFHQQLVPNLPKKLRPLYIFFAKISVYNLIFGKIKVQKVSSESLLYDADSAKDSTSSYIQKDESSANR